MICAGMQQREIAHRMKCTEGTVGVYLSRVRAKLSSAPNAQAAAKYQTYQMLLARGLITGESLDAGAIALVEPAPHGDGLAQPGAQVAATDTPSGGNGGGVQADQHPDDASAGDLGPANT